MSAKFLAVGSFFVKSRNLYMIVGDVVGGEVKAGSFVSIRLNPSLSIAAKVGSVEVVEVAHEERNYLGLVIEYDDAEDLEMLAGLGVGGETLELAHPTALYEGHEG